MIPAQKNGERVSSSTIPRPPGRIPPSTRSCSSGRSARITSCGNWSVSAFAAGCCRTRFPHPRRCSPTVARHLRRPRLDALRRAPAAPGVLPDPAPAVPDQYEQQQPHGQPAGTAGGAFAAGNGHRAESGARFGVVRVRSLVRSSGSGCRRVRFAACAPMPRRALRPIGRPAFTNSERASTLYRVTGGNGRVATELLPSRHGPTPPGRDRYGALAQDAPGNPRDRRTSRRPGPTSIRCF